MSGIVWLHVSDWHQSTEQFDRKVVFDALIADIRARVNIAPELARVDLIFFSGDIAWSGKEPEYDDAREQFFKPLLESTGRAKDDWTRLFVVPGNHDLDRDAIKRVPNELVTGLCSREGINDALGGWKRLALLSPFSAYSTFAALCGGEASEKICVDPAYYCVSRIKVRDKYIAIICLNSAWASGRKFDSANAVNDYGHLIMGERQVYCAIEDVRKIGTSDVTVAIMHHPFTWLIEHDRDLVEERLFRHCHFILHGHEHRPRVNVHRSTLGDVVTIPAGASYDRRRSPDPRYTNAYNFVHLDFDKNRGTTYLRRWSEQQGKWIADNDLWDEGRFSFSMPKSSDWLSREAREARTGLLSKFERNLRRRFCNSLEVSIRHTLEAHSGTNLIKQQMDFKYEFGPGPSEAFSVTTFVNSRVAELVRKGLITIAPYTLRCFTINGDAQDPIATSHGDLLCNANLEEGPVSIVYSFTTFEMPDGVYRLQLGRFTKFVKVSFQKDKRLVYEFASMGGLAPMKPVRHSVFDTEEMKTPGLCYPHQGYLFQWYPPVATA